uniref:Sortilin n=1 Tax=Echinococcus granulosus TaxID=6210 RepID=A0A068WEW3_ECHGR|nr:sortilin [Echinococcus granulosus]
MQLYKIDLWGWFIGVCLWLSLCCYQLRPLLRRVQINVRLSKSYSPMPQRMVIQLTSNDTKETIQLTWAGDAIGDGGITWELVLRNVQECFWSSFNVDSKSSLYALHGKVVKKSTGNRGAFTLSKSEDSGKNWRVILVNVRKIWAPEVMRSDADLEEDSGRSQYEPSGRFLYAAHFADEERNLLQLSVSDDGGNSFRRVYLPTVFSDQFFSVLEIEKDCVFLHVDEPGDTGHGILYVSDSTGTVFTESLRRHFYPNHATVTDFFRILSIPGTFLATQMNPDTTLRTVITHDRGSTWQPLPVPEGLSCDLPSRGKMISEQAEVASSDSAASAQPLKSVAVNVSGRAFELVCGLQVSNQFSLRKRVVASPPLATSTARGLILVHGHVATHLKTIPADVFISVDGGYTWHKGLDGPHHYQIANRGGLIVAVPADTLWVDILRFSTDGGRCWHNIPLTPSIKPAFAAVDKKIDEVSPSPPTKQSIFSTDRATLQTTSSLLLMEEETIVFTGLVTEPGGHAMTVAVYGYGTVSQRWRVAVVDFASNGFITKNCTVEDYDLWYPHQTGVKHNDPNDGCLLGVRETSYRLKENSLCFSRSDFRSLQSYEICSCTEQDYECTYGYWRELDGDGKCVVNPHAPPLDVCELLGQKVAPHLLEMIGYRLIPGDRCQGGWQPPYSNYTFEALASHCPPKPKPFGTATKFMVVVVALTIFFAFVGGIVWSRRRAVIFSNTSLRHRRFTEIFCRHPRHSHLSASNDFKTNRLVSNTVFYAGGDFAIAKTVASPSSTSHHLTQKQSEDRFELVANEELFADEDTFPPDSMNGHSTRSEQGRMDDLLY